MKVIFLLILGLLSFSSFAERFYGKIYDIEPGKNGKGHLILMTDGQAFFIDGKSADQLEIFNDHKKRNDFLEIERDENNQMISARLSSPGRSLNSENSSIANIKGDHPPVDDKVAQTLFGSMRRDYQNESQCYNRAHVWTYEAFKSGYSMGKIFLFFTYRYIRNYNFGWWFHVTPTYNGLAMDRRYTSGPLNLRTWTNIFVRSRRNCPVITKYSSYSNNQYSEDCYAAPTTKYFWQPYDLSNFERWGTQKTSYIMSEVNWAYWEAF